MQQKITDDKLVLVASIGSAHGVKGLLRLKSFLENPNSLEEYSPLLDQQGLPRFRVTLQQMFPTYCLVHIAGVETRAQAEQLRGTSLYVNRSRLKPVVNRDEFYIIDLVGLRVIDLQGVGFGVVQQVSNYGAGDILQIRLQENHQELFVPFTKHFVPEVNLNDGYIVVNKAELEL